LRLLVPLVVTREQFEEGLNVLESALEIVAESQIETAPRHA
jgi:4-aminobutyrate aminotransferase-like enzyme